jgi:hypothetical protein
MQSPHAVTSQEAPSVTRHARNTVEDLNMAIKHKSAAAASRIKTTISTHFNNAQRQICAPAVEHGDATIVRRSNHGITATSHIHKSCCSYALASNSQLHGICPCPCPCSDIENADTACEEQNIKTKSTKDCASNSKPQNS